MYAEDLEKSLERVVEVHGDPVDLVYERLFKLHPNLEPLFDLDTDKSVRGHMFNEALFSLIDMAKEDRFGSNFIAIEHFNHEGYGVSTDVFEHFYSIVRDVFRDLLAEDWTPEFELAWSSSLAKLEQLFEKVNA